MARKTFPRLTPVGAPRLDEALPLQDGVYIYRFAAYSANGAMAVPDEEGLPSAEYPSQIDIAGDGIYVDDAPLGWPGLLIVNDRSYRIAPGMHIPERYTAVRLTGIPGVPGLPATGPQGTWYESPITLVLGPRAITYDRPGWRTHWRAVSPNFGSIAPGERSSFSDWFRVREYNWTTIIMRPNHNNTATWRPEYRFRYGLPAAYSLDESPTVQTALAFSSDYSQSYLGLPVYHGGPGSRPTGSTVRGVHAEGWSVNTPGSTPAVPLPAGLAAVDMSVRIYNIGTSLGTLNPTMVVFGGFQI